MMLHNSGNSIIKITFPVFLATFFWQTRIALGGQDVVYDYLIPFAYVTTMLLLILFVGYTLVDGLWFIKLWVRYRRMVSVSIIFFIFAGWVITTRALDAIAGWYWLFTFIAMCQFALWLRYVRKKYPVSYIMSIISVGLVPLIVLGVIEMVGGRTLGLKFMGEWDFSSLSLGVATAELFGVKVLLPYATFPHPNVFGGVMTVFLLYWLYQWLHARLLGTYTFFSLLFVSIFAFGVILSHSLTAVLALLVGTFFYVPTFKKLSKENKLSRNEYAVGGVLILVVLFLTVYYVSQLFAVDSLSFLRRWYLNDVGISIIREHPWFGVGVNQSILYVSRYWDNTALPQFTQPIHNVWILLVAESGFIGASLLFLSGYFAIVRRWRYLPVFLKSMVAALVVISLFDHYLITLQSGLLLLFLTVGLSLRYDEHSEITSDTV